jgi:hypothetical protein
MLPITPSDALILEADYLTDAISGLIPTPTVTAVTVNQLLEIYKQQARATRDAVTAQRVLSEHAHVEQTIQEEHQQQVAPSYLRFELEQTSNTPTPPGILQTTQDNQDLPPSANTCQQLTLTQDFMLQYMEIPGYKTSFTPQQAASHRHPLQFLCDLAYAILDDKMGNVLEYHHLMKHPKHKDIWTKSSSKEIVCLPTTTETIFFINKNDIPEERCGDVTYGRIACMYADEKKDKFCMRITMGGNLINYPDNCGTPTGNLLTVKLLLNSVTSTPNVKFMMLDLKDFYLMYSHIKLESFPQDIINLYNLSNKVDNNGNVHCKVCRGIYGLSQAGLPRNS